MFDINFGIKKISMDMIREWAHEATNTYLTTGVEPSFTIEKIASSEELLPHQIQTLCAEANKLIHTQKYASETDKYHAANFPHADASRIIDALKVSDQVKIGSMESFQPDVSDELDLSSYFGIDEGQGHTKSASLKQEASTAVEKLEDFVKKASLDEIEQQSKLESSQNSFVKQAVQMLNVCDNESSRLSTLGQIFLFTKSAGFETKGKDLLNKVAHVISYNGLISKESLEDLTKFFMSKEADCKAPQSLISDELLGKVQIVNGDHPLYITLETINKYDSELAKTRDYSNIAQDKLKILKQKIRAL